MRYALLILALLTGCGELSVQKWAVNQDIPEAEVPVANIPPSMHRRNWTEKGTGQGSCVHASTLYCLLYMGEYEMADWWQKSHAGGETANSIRKQYEDAGLNYISEDQGDPWIFDYATENRLATILWHKPSHCCSFLGYSTIDGQVMAVIYDNNYPGKLEYHEKEKFIRAWRGFGGFAAIPLAGSPTPPLPYPSLIPIE